MTVRLPSGRRQLAVMWEKERTTQCQALIFQLSVSGETSPICARGMFHWPRNTVLDLSMQKKAGSNCYSLYLSGCNKPSVGRVIGRFRNISKHPSPRLESIPSRRDRNREGLSVRSTNGLETGKHRFGVSVSSGRKSTMRSTVFSGGHDYSTPRCGLHSR